MVTTIYIFRFQQNGCHFANNMSKTTVTCILIQLSMKFVPKVQLSQHWFNIGVQQMASYSFVYTSGHCRRWRSRMEVKIMAGSLFVHCKIVYFYSVIAEKWLVVSLPNFVTIRGTHLSISCKIFNWIRTTKLKIYAMEFCDFIKDSVSPSGLFVPCSLTVTSTWRPRLTAHCPIRELH